MEIVLRMKYSIIYSIIGAMLLGCQDEIDIDTSNENTNNKESVFTVKAKRNSLLDGSLDDILDQSPCATITLPVQIKLNQIPLNIESPADLELIGDTDVVELVYPLTVTTMQYNTVTFHNEKEWTDFQNDCSRRIADNQGPITCVDIEYPVSIFTITNNDQQNKHVMESKKDFYFFLNNLSDADLYSMDYPITLLVNRTAVSIDSDISYMEYLDSCNN